MLTVLHDQWFALLRTRASAMDFAAAVAALIVVWLLLVRWQWPRLLPLLRLVLVTACLVALLLTGGDALVRSRAPRVSHSFDTRQVFGWSDASSGPDSPLELDSPAGPRPASAAPRR